MPMVAGHRARIYFGADPYAMKSWSLESECTPLDCSNTEGRPGNPLAANQTARGFASTLVGLRRCRCTFRTATYDTTFPFGGPATWREGMYLTDCFIYPNNNALTGAAIGAPFTFQSVIVSKITVEGEVDGLQPVTIEGVSDGFFDFGFGALDP